MTDIKPGDGPIATAWKEWQRTYQNTPLGLGRQTTAVVYDEAGTSLLKDLTDSLWALATLHSPVFTQADLYRHVGPGHMQDDWMVKRLNGQTEVFLLCPCKVILVLARCYGFDALTGEQCEEWAFPIEATLRSEVRCGNHRQR